MIDPHNSNIIMETFTIQEFQEDFDNLLGRVETGESFMITSEGKEVIIMPAEDYNYIVYGDDMDDLIRIHTDHEEGS
jgi:prevent-host-death family protein